jgi:hypothetical protein
MAEKSATPDQQVAQKSGRQYGVISTRQLREAGLSGDAVLGRLQAGRLHRIHRGVYAVGHPGLSFEGRWMAAVLALGVDAALSHRSAAGLWGLIKPVGGSVEVSIPRRTGRRSRAGIRIHRCPGLAPDQVTKRRGIPVTTVARTIADLRRTSAPVEVRRAVRQAGVLGLSSGLDDPGEPTRSELEDRFLRLCARHGLPAPEVNVRVGSRLVDFLWRAERVVVETDGYRYHRGAQAFEDDHDRNLEMRGLGYDLIRLSYRQVNDDPGAAAGYVREALRTSGDGGRGHRRHLVAGRDRGVAEVDP